MIGDAELIAVDGSRSAIAPANNKYFGLNELYKLIDCRCIEIIPLSHDKCMIIDEQGKLTNRPQNILATKIANLAGCHDLIVGTVIICLTSHLP